MKIIYSEPCRSYPPATIQLRDPSVWGNEPSIKFSYPDKNGNPARTGPETPLHSWVQMTDVAVNKGPIPASDIAAVLPSDALLREVEARMFAGLISPKLVAGILFHVLAEG
jgi:hypothetical protein